MHRISERYPELMRDNVGPGTLYGGHGTRVYGVDISITSSYSTAFGGVGKLTPEQVWRASIR